jgi:Cu2+-containing amine oxidase
VVLNDPKGAGARYISYDLVPMVSGIARHPRADESFSKHDFWITRADSTVKQYIHLGSYFENGKARNLEDGPLVLWHMSSALHVPRTEDGILKGSSIDNGQALASWTVVELRPRHLFTGTPIYRGPK